MRAEDQYHVGIVVEDVDVAQAELSALAGYVWAPEIAASVNVRTPDEDLVLAMRVAYSVSQPRLELIHAVPGTLWVPAAGSGVHHVGYWSDSVAADTERLGEYGYQWEAQGLGDGGEVMWSYSRSPAGPRIELVSRTMEPYLASLWAPSGT